MNNCINCQKYSILNVLLKNMTTKYPINMIEAYSEFRNCINIDNSFIKNFCLYSAELII